MGRLRVDVATLCLSLLANLLLVLISLGRQNEVSVLKGGWFLPYPLAGKVNDRDFCCQDCVNLWGCSICHRTIGLQPGSPLIFGHFCGRIFHACSDAYFGRDTNTLDLAPCSPWELVCAKASHLFSNGTELCKVADFSVLPVDSGNPQLTEEYYYRTQDSLYSIHPSWKPSQKKKPHKSKLTGKPKCEVFNEDAPSPVKKNEVFNNGVPSLVRKISLDRKFYCGMVLTVLAAGLFFLRFRRRDPNLERVAAILRAKENVDGVLKKNKKWRKKKNM